MYLFFDVETTGKPKNYNAPISDLENWPRIVQFAWIKFDKQGKKLSEKSYIIKPNGFIIPSDSVKIHKITTQRALKKGIPIEKVLKEFSVVIKESNYAIAHNVDFDYSVISAEFLRSGIKHDMKKIKKFCTMKSTTDFCKIVNTYGYKYPKQQELHVKLFHKSYKNAHNALTDASICAKCFFELKKIGFIKI